MLFSLASQTPQCKVFEFLNDELLVFLSNTVHSINFNENLFSTFVVEEDEVKSVCWTNVPTREKFRALWDELNKPGISKINFYNQASSSQNIQDYFNNLALELPIIEPAELFEALKSITTHLYTRTKDLEATKVQCKSSIEKHYQLYKVANQNSSLCYLCGTAQLSQDRLGFEEDEQWRSDYDHLLCKDKYPLYSVHPGNFIPTCHICNSKAKGARNLLKDSVGARRAAFYSLPPSTESCDSYIRVSFTLKSINQLTINDDAIAPLDSLDISFVGMSPLISKKIDVWMEVYQVPERVKSEINSSVIDRISSDLRPANYDDFKNQLTRFVNSPVLDLKSSSWRFWWQKLYDFLSGSDENFLKNLWSLIEYKQLAMQPNDMQNTFGV